MRSTRKVIAPIAATVLLVLAATPSQAFAQFAQPSFESAIFQWTNVARQMQTKRPLQYNEQLAKAALRHAWNMAMQDVMSHKLDGESVADRARRSGYQSSFVGENIAYNFGYTNPAWQLFDGWMKSPGHYANIVNDQYTELGVGVVRTSAGKYYACQVFGSPQPQIGPYIAPQYQTHTSPAWLTSQRRSDFNWYYIPEWD